MGSGSGVCGVCAGGVVQVTDEIIGMATFDRTTIHSRLVADTLSVTYVVV